MTCISDTFCLLFFSPFFFLFYYTILVYFSLLRNKNVIIYCVQKQALWKERELRGLWEGEEGKGLTITNKTEQKVP